MLTWLQELESLFGPFRLFGYMSVRSVGAALTAFVLMLVVMPRLIAALRRRKLAESGGKGEGAVVVDAMRQAKAGTPTMGGLGLVGCLILSALLWCDLREPSSWLMMFAAVSFAWLGYLDDRTKVFKGAKGMRSRTKALLQLAVAIICGLWFLAIDQATIVQTLTPELKANGAWAWNPTYSEPVGHVLMLPFLDLKHLLPIGAVGMLLWTIAVSFACSNSVNFTDGMDGLAAGTMLVAALAFMAIAYAASHFVAAHHLGILYVPGSKEVAVFCAATAGACLGFLWFNAAPAQIFMGDTGSQALGGVLALASLCTKQEFLILLVGFVFFVEGLSVFLQVAYFKATGGKRLFRCAPIHHHFQYLGWPETKIVFRFWVVAAVAALLALASLKLR